MKLKWELVSAMRQEYRSQTFRLSDSAYKRMTQHADAPHFRYNKLPRRGYFTARYHGNQHKILLSWVLSWVDASNDYRIFFVYPRSVEEEKKIHNGPYYRTVTRAKIQAGRLVR